VLNPRSLAKKCDAEDARLSPPDTNPLWPFPREFPPGEEEGNALRTP